MAPILLQAWTILLAVSGGEASETPRPMPIAKAVVTGAAGEASLKLDQPNTIDPDARFRLELSARLPDVRLQLLDEQDAAIASTGTADVAGTTKLSLTPTEPLRPGTVYRLRLDGTAEREAHDAAGTRYAPVEIQVKTSGDKPPPQQIKKTKRRRR